MKSLHFIAFAVTLGLVMPVVMANEECPSMQEVMHQLIDNQGCFEHNGTQICNEAAGRAVAGFKSSWGTVGVLGGDIVQTGASSCTYVPTYDNTPPPPPEPPPCDPRGFCETSPLASNESTENRALVIWISNDNEGSCNCGYIWQGNMVFQPVSEFRQHINSAVSQE